MKYDLILKGGLIVDAFNNMEQIGDVGILEGKISDIGTELDYGKAKQIIDVKGKVIMPGLVDSHVHIIKDGTGKAGFRMLVKAGVTTAFEFRGPVDKLADEIVPYGNGLNVAVLNCAFNGREISNRNVPKNEITDEVCKSLEHGAIGIKIMGGHAPLTPVTTKDLIEVTNDEGGYIAFHAGTSATGSNIEGMEEAVSLAEGRPLHVAHINSYCRGLIDHPLEEARRAFELLLKSKNIVSESYLAPFNGTNGEINELGLPTSHVTRNCLIKLGYSVDRKGVRQVLLDKKAAIYMKIGKENELIWGENAYNLWVQKDTKVNMSFMVNSAVVAAACAAEKDTDGQFVVNALSTDGGAIPRNFTLRYGIPLVDFGAITLKELVWKASYAPAQLIGLKNKGHLSIGADADIVVVDRETASAKITIINGKVSMIDGYLTSKPGKLLTTQRGAVFLRKNKIPYEVIDLNKSTYINGKSYLKRNCM